MIRKLRKALTNWFYNLLLNALKIAVLLAIGFAIGVGYR